MPTTVTRSPTVVVSSAEAGAGPLPWSGPANAAASDNAYATAFTDAVEATRYLKATGFGFAVPSSATILGVQVEIERSTNLSVRDAVVRLLRAGLIVGANKALTAPPGGTAPSLWPGVDAYQSYGGAADLWAEAWTPAEINAGEFGLVLSALVEGIETPEVFRTSYAFVDHMRISVTYEAFSEPQVSDQVVIGDAVEVEDLSFPPPPPGEGLVSSCTIDFSYWLRGVPTGFMSAFAGDFSYWLRGLPVVHFCTPLAVVDDSVAISDAVAIDVGVVPPISPGGPTWGKLPTETAWTKQVVG